MKGTSSSSTLLAVGLFASQAIASCGHGTSLLRRNVVSKRDLSGLESRAVTIATFGYHGATGPANWASLSPSHSACSNGSFQSPIDVTSTTTTTIPAGSLNITIPDIEHAEFENLGSTIEVVMADKGAVSVIGGKEYALAQFHFHTTGEHTVDREGYPLEMHMVHQAADKAIAVLAFHFQLSTEATTPLLTSLIPYLSAISEPGSITETGPLAFGDLIENCSSVPLYTYSGSLTTPPCTEGPVFYIASERFPIDVPTFNAFKSVLGFNSRFLQNAPGEENILALAAAGKKSKRASLSY